MSTKVYLVQQPTIDVRGWTPDFSSASKYGSITVLLESSFKPSLMPGPAVHQLRRRLRDFTRDDYLLWAGGDPLGLAMAFHLAAEQTQGNVQFLRWERARVDGQRRGGFYMPVGVDFTMRG